MMKAMILCAGLGTRLRPLTDWLAKPMVPIGDAPAASHAARRLRRAGVETLVVNVHHRPEDLEAWAARSRIDVSNEPELLGTAGGIANARRLLGAGDVLVWNGDMVGELAIESLVEKHGVAKPLATLAIASRPRGEGNVGVGPDGRIVRLRRASYGEEQSGGDFLGVHVLSDEGRELLPARGCLVGDAWIPALARGGHLEGFVTEAQLCDVGTLGAYVAANRAWLAARGQSSWAAATATIEAPIDGSIVGEGARIEASATRCIVWPHACVMHPVENAIVTPFGTCPIQH